MDIWGDLWYKSRYVNPEKYKKTPTPDQMWDVIDEGTGLSPALDRKMVCPFSSSLLLSSLELSDTQVYEP